MRHTLPAAALLFAATLAHAEPPKVLATGLEIVTSVAVGADGRPYVCSTPKNATDGQGTILRIENGKPVPFATGLNKPYRIVAFQQWLFVLDRASIVRIDAKGKIDVVATSKSFPTPVEALNDVAIDGESGILYVCYSDSEGKNGGIYRVTPRGKVDAVLDQNRFPGLAPIGLAMDGASHLLFSHATTGNNSELYRVGIAGGSTEKIASGPGMWTSPIWDKFGRLFFMNFNNQILYAIPRPGAKPVPIAGGVKYPCPGCLSPDGKSILIPDALQGTLTSVPISIPGHEVDTTPLPLHTEVAFPNLKWTGWQGETDSGKPNPLRPIVLTHAGDGSGRVFVATEHGVIHHFPNDQNATKTTVFLDIQDRVSYRDDQNEEGFLGLAFHPKFKDNGEFFVFYTPKKEKMTNLVSRFRVRKDDPSRADPDSEEVIIRFKKPFWNHDGGTILFGPDGYLYVTHGDGGAANDPYDNAQKTNSWLGKILRLDVDSPTRISKEKNYAVPKDNPFVGKNGYCPEIWALGLRNVWRMAFDSKTGKLWAADVGQNLWEEINIIEKGGNYGWNRREGLHPFGAKGTGPRKEFIDPIWEYHHDIGKSITGGTVYRGKSFPEIEGHYLYADYVSGKIWALKYDEAKKRVVANRPIKDRSLPIMSWGEDDKGEVNLMTMSATGQGIYRLAK